MRGPTTFVPHVMRLFIDMDRMISKAFEVGLQKLNAIAGK